MKTNLFIGIVCLAGLSLVGCKTKESSFKKAYEQAKAEEMAQQQTTTTTPVQVTPVTPVTTPTTPVADDNTAVRTERIDVLNGGSLKAYNVVCGSFKVPENANNRRNELVNMGYNAQVAVNPETGMYRVIASSFDDKASASQSRQNLLNKYPDAWILYRTY